MDKFKVKEFKDWFSYGIGFAPMIFKPSEITDQRNLINFKIKISPIEHLYFSFQRLLNFNEERNIYYQPEFYYSFGYQDYNSDGWGFNYSNYENNQFTNGNNAYAGSFEAGTWEVNYKKTIEDFSFKGKISYQHEDRELFVGLHTTIKLTDKTDILFAYDHYLDDPQQRLAIAIKSKIVDKFFVEGGIYLYSDYEKQQDHESDYYYSIGWRDYRKYHFSVIFSNQYSATRFPWREQEDIPFNEGQISISFNF